MNTEGVFSSNWVNIELKRLSTFMALYSRLVLITGSCVGTGPILQSNYLSSCQGHSQFYWKTTLHGHENYVALTIQKIWVVFHPEVGSFSVSDKCHQLYYDLNTHNQLWRHRSASGLTAIWQFRRPQHSSCLTLRLNEICSLQARRRLGGCL